MFDFLICDLDSFFIFIIIYFLMHVFITLPHVPVETTRHSKAYCVLNTTAAVQSVRTLWKLPFLKKDVAVKKRT